MTSSVSALYFEYYYFETDQLVYEVGETINMVSKIIADFSEDGWCYVSFEVVTDLGPKFFDGYSIPSSPDIRFLTSSYLIAPEDSSPGISGATGYVIFNVEVFDTFSQGDGETIEIQLARGQIEAVALSPTNIDFGTNNTLDFIFQSIHTDQIVYSNRSVSVIIQSLTAEKLLEFNTTSDINGHVYVNWTDSLTPPGSYNLTFTTLGDGSFQPLSQSFDIIVQPASSNLQVVSFNDTVHCKSSYSNHSEKVNITVEHIDQWNNPIEGSTIDWTTQFSSGIFTELGLGVYWVSIPFEIEPGQWSVNLTSSNPFYQSDSKSVEINVIRRQPLMELSTDTNPLSGEIWGINITLLDNLCDCKLESLPLIVNISINNQLIDIFIGVTDSTGQFRIAPQLPNSLWGLCELSVMVNESVYYTSLYHQEEYNISFIPRIEMIVLEELALGQNTSIQVILLNPNNTTISSLGVELRYTNGTKVTSSYSDTEGVALLSWTVSAISDIGIQPFTINLAQDTSRYLSNVSIPIELFVHYPLFLNITQHSWSTLRGNNFTFQFIIESPLVYNSTIQVDLFDNQDEMSQLISGTTDTILEIELMIDNTITVGPHTLTISVRNDTFLPIGLFVVELIVIGVMDVNLSIHSAFYSEILEINCSSLTDNNESTLFFHVYAYLENSTTPFATLTNETTNSMQSIPLPSWISPGNHSIQLNISSHWFSIVNKTIQITIWMRTSINLSFSKNSSYNQGTAEPSTQYPTQFPITNEMISSGSIMSPPPILFNETTSISEPTALCTSLESCPRLSSGTNNFSTVSANCLISISGNGQRPLNLRDRGEAALELLAIISSTDLDVHP